MAVLGNRVIKSIQRGSTSPSNNGTTAVTISSVDTSKAFVSASCKNGMSAGQTSGGSGADMMASSTSGAALTGATTLTVYGGTASYAGNTNTASTLYWEVIEYE